jgi:DNA-binding PadR family transcriptional regulator
MRFTAPSTRILDYLAQQPSEWVHGYPILKETCVGSGTLYPALYRLTEQGLLESRVTDEGIDEYRISGEGIRVHARLVVTKPQWWFLPRTLGFKS